MFIVPYGELGRYNALAVGAHYSPAPTGSVVLHVSAGDRLLTRGQPIRLLFSLPNWLPLFFFFASLHLFCFIYLLIRVTEIQTNSKTPEQQCETHWICVCDEENKCFFFYFTGCEIVTLAVPVIMATHSVCRDTSQGLRDTSGGQRQRWYKSIVVYFMSKWPPPVSEAAFRLAHSAGLSSGVPFPTTMLQWGHLHPKSVDLVLFHAESPNRTVS